MLINEEIELKILFHNRLISLFETFLRAYERAQPSADMSVTYSAFPFMQFWSILVKSSKKLNMKPSSCSMIF